MGNARKTLSFGLVLIVLITLTSAYGASNVPSIIQAVKDQDFAATAALIKKDVDVNEPQADGATALHWAVHRNDLKIAGLLLETGAHVDATNDFGINPLWLACENRNAEVAKLLLNAGADPNGIMMTGESLLMVASHNGSINVVRLLLKAGANPNLTEPVRKQTALMWAIGEKHTEIALLLLEAGSDVNAKTTFSFTPLMFASRNGETEIAKALLQRGADPNAAATFMGTNIYQTEGVTENTKNNPGLSVLQVAVQRGHADIVDLLLDAKADPDYDKSGYTALLWACGSWETSLDGVTGILPQENHEWYSMGRLRKDRYRVIESLLEHGANPDARLESSPSRYGFSPNPRPKGATPYILAAIAADARAMDILIRYGADPTLMPNNNVPAILLAAGVNRSLTNSLATEEQSINAVKMAMAHGATVHDKDKHGNTVLHGAAKVRMTGLIQFLVDEGADLFAKNKSGQNPEYMASHELRGAGEVPIESSPTLDLVRELSKPVTLTKAIEEWMSLAPHVQKSIEALLQGEHERIAEAAKVKKK